MTVTSWGGTAECLSSRIQKFVDLSVLHTWSGVIKTTTWFFSSTLTAKPKSFKNFKDAAQFGRNSNISIKRVALSDPTLSRKKNSAKNSKEQAELWQDY